VTEPSGEGPGLGSFGLMLELFPHPPHLPNLALRLITAAIGLPLIFLVTWVGGFPFAIVAAAIAFLAATEFVHGWLLPSLPIPTALRHAPLYTIVAAVVLGAHVDPGYFWLGVGFALLYGILGYTPTNAFGPRNPFRVLSSCVVYIGMLMATFVLVRDVPDGREWVALAILSTFAVDTGAFAVGKLIGRHKMAPRISPHKTWEGAVGGYVAGVAACFGLNALFDTGVPATTLVHLALALPVFAEVGDLFESWMKRRMGVKDASGLLPGHGGFLDRLDSLLFVMPLVYLFLRLRVL
jgi:phosphatidate cytidylyltransferase